MEEAERRQREEVPREGHGQAGPPGDEGTERGQPCAGQARRAWGADPPPLGAVVASGKALASEDCMLVLPTGPHDLGL